MSSTYDICDYECLAKHDASHLRPPPFDFEQAHLFQEAQLAEETKEALHRENSGLDNWAHRVQNDPKYIVEAVQERVARERKDGKSRID
jgi:hypothetical protein